MRAADTNVLVRILRSRTDEATRRIELRSQDETMSTTALLTFAEFEQLPDAPGKRELIDGEVMEMPPPQQPHVEVAKALYKRFLESAVEPRCYLESGYRIAGGWVQPDLSVAWPDQRLENGYFIGAPALAVEILSRSNTAGQIDRKLTLYFTEGAREVWVINPDKRSMTVYQREGDHEERRVVQDRYVSPAFEVTINLDQIFPRIR